MPRLEAIRVAWGVAREVLADMKASRPVRGWRKRDCRKCQHYDHLVTGTFSGGMFEIPLTVRKCCKGRRLVMYGDWPRCGAYKKKIERGGGNG